MALRVCSVSGCPELVRSGKCAEHSREADKARGSSGQRGYDYKHQRQRKAWAPKVRAGYVDCRRCGKAIRPSEPWDLGHPDADCGKPTAPEHRACNRAVAGR